MQNFQNPYQPYQRLNMYPQQTNGITWVQGIEGAKAFQLAPNSNIILMDSENDRFFIKTCDNIGMCNLRIFNYQELTELDQAPKSNEIDLSLYVTRDEVERMIQDAKGNNYGKQSLQPTKSDTNKSAKQ